MFFFLKPRLQADSMNLSLWSAFAMIERTNQNIKEARRIYIKSLSLYEKDKENEITDQTDKRLF